MQAAATFGLLLGVVTVVFTRLFPEPLGVVALWSGLGCYLLWGAQLVWRRTGLALMAGAMGLGAVVLIINASLALAGHVLPDLPPVWWILNGVCAVAMPASSWAESKRHPEEIAKLRQHMEGMSVWDLIRGRHILHLRQDATRG